MRAASYQSSSYRSQGSHRDRLTSGALAAIVTVLIVWMLIRMGALGPLAPTPPAPTTIQLLPDAPIQEDKSRAVRKVKRSGGGSAPKSPTPSPVPAPPNRATPHAAAPAPWNVIPLTSAEFAATDVSKMPSHPAQAASGGGDGGDSAGHGRGEAEGNGDGPGGARLYNADWYRRPTRAEIDTYLPPHMPPDGWGDVACRTIPRYHVEDCRELGESPTGSGLARAVREAAWQFLVMPPRVDGRPQIGVWVRIHYSFTTRPLGSSGGDDAGG